MFGDVTGFLPGTVVMGDIVDNFDDYLHGFQDRCPRKDQIGAFRADARLRRALPLAHRAEPSAHRLALAARHPESVHFGPLVARQSKMQPGEAGDRA